MARPPIYSKASREHPLFKTWKNILTRCNNPNAANYRYYGGKGLQHRLKGIITMGSIDLVTQWWIDETYEVMHPSDNTLKGWPGFIEYWQSIIRNRHLNKMDLEDCFCTPKNIAKAAM